MNRTTKPAMGIGVITVFMILIVLALTIFSMLTYSSAYADLRLSNTNADHMAAYYNADYMASNDAYAFANNDAIAISEQFEHSYPLEGTNTELHILLEKNGDDSVSILAWNTVSTVIVDIDAPMGNLFP